MRRVLASFFCLFTAFLFATGCNPPDTGIPADHFQVRFSGDLASQRKFAIGKDTGSLVIDPGYFTNNTTTGFHHAPAGEYNLYDRCDFDADWNLRETYAFEAQKRYEVEGAGLNMYSILVLP